jgi:hypothetical protein
VALGTVLFADPGAPTRVRAELVAELAAREPSVLDGVRPLPREAVGKLAMSVENPWKSA